MKLTLLYIPLLTSDISINSCLRPLCSINGMAVTTIEGIGSQKKGYHPIQVSSHSQTMLNFGVGANC